jgi:hypothetical protein
MAAVVALPTCQAEAACAQTDEQLHCYRSASMRCNPMAADAAVASPMCLRLRLSVRRLTSCCTAIDPQVCVVISRLPPLLLLSHRGRLRRSVRRLTSSCTTTRSTSCKQGGSWTNWKQQTGAHDRVCLASDSIMCLAILMSCWLENEGAYHVGACIHVHTSHVRPTGCRPHTAYVTLVTTT